jgi:hypothetical protein
LFEEEFAASIPSISPIPAPTFNCHDKFTKASHTQNVGLGKNACAKIGGLWKSFKSRPNSDATLGHFTLGVGNCRLSKMENRSSQHRTRMALENPIHEM